MRYFVIAPDGSKFGPADLATLRAWIAEGRIAPDTVLEEESSRQRVPAKLVAGLTFAVETPSFSAPAGSRYPRAETPAPRSGEGNMDLIWSYLCSALSIICCGLFIFGAFAYASRAKAKGNPGAPIAFWVAVFFLILWIITTIIEVMFFRQLMDFFTKAVGGGGG